MGHSILNWASYAQLHLRPVLTNQTTYIPFIFLMFLTRFSELILSLCISWMLLGVIGSSIYFISNQTTILSKRRCHLRPNWVFPKKCRCCKLHYYIICRCRSRPKNRPPRLYVSLFQLLYCASTQHWRREREHVKDFFKGLHMDGFLSGHKNGYHPWESECVSRTSMDSFCDDKNRDLLQLHRLMSSFTKLDHLT